MKVKAKDQLHVSSVRAETFRAGDEFDVSDPVARDLIKRGLVARVTAPKKKRAQEPDNKQAPAADNKAG